MEDFTQRRHFLCWIGLEPRTDLIMLGYDVPSVEALCIRQRAVEVTNY